MMTLILTALNAVAAGPAYHLQMDFSLDGKHVSSPVMVVEAGKTGTIIQDTAAGKTFLEVTPAEAAHHGIKMKFVVGKLSSSGEKRDVTKPQIVARENEKATVSVGDGEGREQVSLSVIARRQTL